MKRIKKIIACVLVGVSAASITFAIGCENTTQSNPYLLVANVNSVDNTPFFNKVYLAFLRLGIISSTDTTDTSTSKSIN